MTVNLASGTFTDYTNAVPALTIKPMNTDGITSGIETRWTNNKWSKQWGLFNSYPDLKSAILMKAIWDVGKGYTTDNASQTILDHISGWGKDTFDDILFNMVVVMRVGGDSYAEIIRDKETNKLINLKVLDPSTITHIIGENGRIIRYEQTTKTGDIELPVKKFEPKDLLHFSHNRLADQIHGISDIDALLSTIEAEQESFELTRKVMRLQTRPFILWKLKTDNPDQIARYKYKLEQAKKLGEDLVIPDDANTVSWEIVEINVSNAIFEWRNDIRNRYYRGIGLPQIIPGAGGQNTESEGKVIYLAHENIVEHDQRKIEKWIWNQLYIKLDLYGPISMQPSLASDASKDVSSGIQPSDTTAGVGR